jgi:hypothetical protein
LGRNLPHADLDLGLARRLRRLVRNQDRRRDCAGQGDRNRDQDGGLESVEECIRGGVVEPRARPGWPAALSCGAAAKAVPPERCALSAIGAGSWAGSDSVRRLA